MAHLVALLTLSLVSVWLSIRTCMAEDTVEENAIQNDSCSLYAIVRELEAQLKNTEKQLDDLRAEIQGKNNCVTIFFDLCLSSSFQVVC